MTGEHRRAVCRLLPWDSPEGKPAYLVTDDPEGMLSLLADGIEDTQVDTARRVLAHAREMLADERVRMTGDEYAFVTRRLAECLHDLLRIVASRGARLGIEELPVRGS
ncbi:hypothetical protein RM572_13520 [Streptomyces sp. DSM 42041]|uniref:Uncharacterized protein n=1 Tax=Streptomyces hazeniae TaxID=3075538 RepID=A0ABU2NS18_9ACTN|nr:hypothetical protein [Streptomyces sp. DSM 42041]MDT0379779.1 hypothetical protein [Streptomyces sp. DSM 42041]